MNNENIIFDPNTIFGVNFKLSLSSMLLQGNFNMIDTLKHGIIRIYPDDMTLIIDNKLYNITNCKFNDNINAITVQIQFTYLNNQLTYDDLLIIAKLFDNKDIELMYIGTTCILYPEDIINNAEYILNSLNPILNELDYEENILIEYHAKALPYLIQGHLIPYGG